MRSALVSWRIKLRGPPHESLAQRLVRFMSFALKHPAFEYIVFLTREKSQGKTLESDEKLYFTCEPIDKKIIAVSLTDKSIRAIDIVVNAYLYMRWE